MEKKRENNKSKKNGLDIPTDFLFSIQVSNFFSSSLHSWQIVKHTFLLDDICEKCDLILLS